MDFWGPQFKRRPVSQDGINDVDSPHQNQIPWGRGCRSARLVQRYRTVDPPYSAILTAFITRFLYDSCQFWRRRSKDIAPRLGHCSNVAKEWLQAAWTRKPPLPFLHRCGYGNRGKPQAVYAPLPQPALTLVFLSGFLPMQRNMFIFYPKGVQLPWWVERSMSIRHRKMDGT